MSSDEPLSDEERWLLKVLLMERLSVVPTDDQHSMLVTLLRKISGTDKQLIVRTHRGGP